MAIPNGEVYLLHNVPLNASYEHTIDFKDKTEQFNYLRSFIKHSVDKFTYIRKEREYIVVELPLSALDDINYMIFRSAEGERWYYAFVTNKTYVQDNVSQVYFMIDVMQTYMFDYEWRPSFIKQAHVDRWTAEHKPIYSKTDEGLDYGADYSVESGYRLEQSNGVHWLMVCLDNGIVSKSDGLFKIDGAYGLATNYASLTPYILCFVPITKGNTDLLDIQYITYFRHNANSDYQIMDNYANWVYAMANTALGSYVKYISIMSYNPFVSAITVDEDTKRVYVTFDNAITYTGSVEVGHSLLGTLRTVVLYRPNGGVLQGHHVLARANWDIGLEDTLPTAEQWAEIKEKPYTTKRDKRFESKLLCAPYRYNLLTDWRNSPAVFKNEYMTTDNIVVKYAYALSYNVPFRYWIENYKRDPEGRYTCLSQAMAPEMPIISDEYYTYMLQNKNTIQANVTNAVISAATNAISGAIAGAGMGGAAGAVYGGVTGAISGALNVQAMVRSENAKQGDLKTKPDTVVNSVDAAFNVIDNNIAINFYRMRICCQSEDIIAEIFNMSGYKVNAVDIPNTRSRTRFNYLQTVGANIVGSINQSDLLAIKQIFDKGITIWHYRASDFNPLDYSYENIEVNLI